MARNPFALFLCMVLICSSQYITAAATVYQEEHISVQDLWEIDENETSPCRIERRYNVSGETVVHGSPRHTCRIQVNTSAGYHAQITMRSNEILQDSLALYIERQGDLLDCPNRYLIFKGQAEACSADLLQQNFQCTLQGNVSVSVSGIGAVESINACPESGGDILSGYTVNHTIDKCKQIHGYNHKISCDPNHNEDNTCRVKFLANCQATLGYREVVFNCTDNVFGQNQKALIMYPVTTFILDLGYNIITKLVGNVFYDLTYLEELILKGNDLTTLHNGIFQQLVNLRELNLNDNQIVTLEENIFQGLAKLTHLHLDTNNLIQVPSTLFSGLENLNVLWLSNNELVTLPSGLFTDQGNLMLLYLYSNELTALPNDLFSDLSNLILYKLYIQGNYLTSIESGTFTGMSKLTVLGLWDNKLTTLPGKLFEYMSNLLYLYLDYNKLSTLPSDLFSGLGQLNRLYLDNNELTKLPSDLFSGLGKLQMLLLSYNNLTTLPGKLFVDMSNLINLYLGYNELTTLPKDLFTGLGQLKTLILSFNNLTTLPENIFWGLANVEQLALPGNQFETLPALTYKNLTNMAHLTLHVNKLKVLPEELFWGLNHLALISISDNEILSLGAGMFQGLRKLYYLAMYNNNLTSLPAELFEGLETLYILTLYGNELVTLDSKTFHNLNDLQNLMLDSNNLQTLPGSVFNGLTVLDVLTFPYNQLAQLDPQIFRGLFNLRFLFLQVNKLSNLNADIFQDIVNITYIDLANNMLTKCPTIRHLIYLNYLNIRDNAMTDVNHETFPIHTEYLELAVSQHEICECYAPIDVECSAGDKRSPYLTCNRLLSDKVLVVLMWLIAINALVGNFYVLVWRKNNTKRYKVQDLLLSNLALSDSLMGIYMLMIGCADFYYGDYFPMQSETWRYGIVCRIAGALSITSSEASVFFVTLISIDRFVSIKFPYSVKKLGKCSTIACAVLIWISSLALGIIPSVLAGNNFEFYDISHVCIGLPLALTKTYRTIQNTTIQNIGETDFRTFKTSYFTQFTGVVNGLYFSSALFLGVNGICYILILGCYIEIFRAVRESAKKSGRTPDAEEQMKLTRKVTAIVATDFLCWAPVIIMGILVQTRVIELPPSVYAWSVTFVLPLNSAINPYLYTIAEIISNYKKKRASQKEPRTQSIAMQLQSSSNAK